MRSSRLNHSPRLYRKAVPGVIFLLLVAGLSAFAQYAKKRQVSKGPRAVGVLELASNGKAHLLPVAIMIDGKFYDAGAYKADPVPMALQPDTVYEAVKSGASEGLFSVSGAINEKDSWVADGKWRSKADIEADKAHAKAEAAKKAYKAPEDVGGPPKLKRAPGDQSSAPSSSPSSPSQPSSSSQQSGQTTGSQQPSSKTETGKTENGKTESDPSNGGAGSSQTKAGSETSVNASKESSSSAEVADRPILRHQAPSETAHEQTKSGNDEPLKGPIQLIPAVSDADGPEPRPYTYQMKPDEQQNFLKKMLAMASADVQARAAHLRAESEPGTKVEGKSSRAEPAPEFQDVQLHVFDLTSSNEPVLVLTATASIPNAKLNLQYSTALVAREDIYGELHKVFEQTTDNQHLDVLPKYEFIDAVDADGDGRGELLFRTTSDSGQAFSIYAVIGDRLWPLFEGRAGS